MKCLDGYTMRLALVGVSVALVHCGSPNVRADFTFGELVGHWKFDDDADMCALDATGNGNDGILEGGPTVVDGQFGGAFAFEWGRVAIPSSYSLSPDLFRRTFTLSSWINPKRTGGMWQQIFRAIRTDDYANDTLFIHNDGRLSWRGRVGDAWAGGMCETAPDVVPANQWTHVAVTGDGTNFRIYVNGELAQEAVFQKTDGGNAIYYFGCDRKTYGEPYRGMIDDARIYCDVLSEDDIKSIMENPNPHPILIVDFNGDGVVDAGDMCSMISHWGEDYSLYDIAPMFWGDGIVDVEDLKVLAQYLSEDITDPTLVAHWPLDEAQGIIAYNYASDRDGTLVNGPAWQPGGGTVGGGLQLDGLDDYVKVSPVLNPADTTFSVFAWVKGGEHDQVIISQEYGANWLKADSAEGCLTTELKGGRRGGPLVSQTVITDGNWHRIGFTWDGTNRTLYVNDIIVAEDAQANLQGVSGGLYIGAGTGLDAGSFWSGMIDDVRIYDRVVMP